MNNSDPLDDIPDTIETDGKIHPFDKEGYKKWSNLSLRKHVHKY